MLDGVECALIDVWQRYRWLGPVGVQVVKQPLRQFEVGVDLIGSEKAQRLRAQRSITLRFN